MHNCYLHNGNIKVTNASKFEVVIIQFTIWHYTTNDIDLIDKSEYTYRCLKGHCEIYCLYVILN